MEKVKIVIIGEKVHQVGYRVFLLNNALNFGIDRFNSYNTTENEIPAVIVFLEADEEIITDYYEFVNINFPKDAIVSKIRKEEFKGRVTSIEQYMHFAMVEQLDKGIPAILDIKINTGKMLEKQDITLEKQDRMLEKQDITIDVLKSVKEDTAQIRQDTARIPDIVKNTETILKHTSHIPAMKEDTASIRYDTKEIATKLWEKYEELSKEIVQMKLTLSKIEAKVFS